MAWELVTSGSDVGSLSSLPDYEEQVEEGRRGRLVLDLNTNVPDGIASGLQGALDAAGVTEAKVVASGNELDIQYKKGFPWLPIIVAAVLASIILAILIVAWQFFKEVEEVVPSGIIIVAVIAGIVLVAVIAFILIRKQGVIVKGG